ncbi:MAG: hypothetical protein PHV18_06675 [Lachnospiraceae bacterium]|nr:hypothetical protein [Lachnospiraceae bacterium]
MANRVYDALEGVRASEELKTSTLEYLQAERERRSRRPAGFFGFPVSLRGFSAAVCLAVLLTAGIGGYSVIRTPVSYISIDVNPSIELALNRLDRVVSAAAYNEDGEIVLDGIAVKGKTYVEAIDTIVESDAMSGYLTRGADLSFTVASRVVKKEQILQTGVEQSHGCKDHGGQSVNVGVELVSEAHGHGVSFGKYAAYLELAQYDGSVTVEDCREMTMSEIHHQIDARKHGCVDGEGGAGDRGGDASYEDKSRHGGHHGSGRYR